MARRQTSEAAPSASPAGDLAGADWLDACRRMVRAQRELFSREHGIAARTVYEGIGEGGDRTLAIDRRSEDIVFAELERLHDDGHDFTAISEERGEVAFGSGANGMAVIVDPLDGSLNARRMLPSFSLSVAVASGPTMADVEVAYVYDFGSDEEYFARRRVGAILDGEELHARGPGFGLEVVGIEGAKPERLIPVLDGLRGKAYRMRSVGSIAISLCYVAGGRFDAMMTGRASRSVDAAAGQLIAREAGAEVAFAGVGLDVSLDLDARYHIAAALDREMLATVLESQRFAEPAGGMFGERFVDWRLAQRVAEGVAGGGTAPPSFSQAAVESACADARGLVCDYTRMTPARPVPPPEVVDRAEWVRVGLGTLRELSHAFESRVASGMRAPGPIGGVARSVAGAAAGAEAGLAVGYGARKVLGQYDVSLTDSERTPRLLFVAHNLATAHQQLGESPELFLRWIAIHETTHAVQFTSVPWLRQHLADLLAELVDGAASKIDQASLQGLAKRIVTTDPRRAIRSLLQGDLARFLAGPEQTRVLDRLQAAMSVIEGHAEHVMDAAATNEPGYARLRERLDARRARRGGLGEVISRLLGMELKLRQYKLGKTFCDKVAADVGIEGLNGVWTDPDALPSNEELERPELWLERMHAPAAAA